MAETAPTKEVKVQASLGEFLNNGLGNFLFGIKRERLPWIQGIFTALTTPFFLHLAIAAGAIGAMTLPGVALVSLGAGAATGALAYLLDRRHNSLKTAMPVAT
jgi:hypothetical protein